MNVLFVVLISQLNVEGIPIKLSIFRNAFKLGDFMSFFFDEISKKPWYHRQVKMRYIFKKSSKKYCTFTIFHSFFALEFTKSLVQQRLCNWVNIFHTEKVSKQCRRHCKCKCNSKNFNTHTGQLFINIRSIIFFSGTLKVVFAYCKNTVLFRLTISR